jgi:hypothetical protein
MAGESNMAVLSARWRRGNPRRWICAGLLALVALGLGATLRAAVDQREVQAVFLLNLSRFIRWPDTAFESEEAPFVIGCLPSDPVASLLMEAAKGELAGKRPIEVREVKTTADLDSCHMIHLSKEDMTQAAQFVAQVRTKPVLTVSDAEAFLRLGGHVQLLRRAGQLKLRIDVGNLRRAELNASAPLLRVAEIAGE